MRASGRRGEQAEGLRRGGPEAAAQGKVGRVAAVVVVHALADGERGESPGVEDQAHDVKRGHGRTPSSPPSITRRKPA